MRYDVARKAALKKHRLLCLFISQLAVLLAAGVFYLCNTRNPFSKIYTEEDFLLYSGEMTDGKAVAEEGRAVAGTFVRVDQALQKGSYLIRVNYIADKEENEFRVASDSLSASGLRADSVMLSPGLQTEAISAFLSEATEDFSVFISYGGEGRLEISEVSVWETNDYYKRAFFYGFLVCVLLAFVFLFWESSLSRRQVMLGLTGIFLLSCYPLYTDYMMIGHDLPFHLLRIEGIYHGLRQGAFPVKIQPVWAQDYGYAVGVFYGDALLYFPALLRFLGFTVQAAYQYFVAAINLGTVLISYYSFRKLFHSSKIGLLGSLLYTLSLYRLLDVYTRAAVGEYTALMFIPLVFCGFYQAFTADREDKHWLQPMLLIVIGLTGVIQSHVLSCEMLAMFILLTCLLLIKRVFRKNTLKTFVTAVLLTAAVNLGFLVPFLDYFREPITIHAEEWIGSSLGSVQEQGMFPVQLLGLFHRTHGGSWAMSAGVHNEASYSLGFVLVLGMLLFVWLMTCYREKLRKDERFTPACVCFGLGVLALFMSTCYFPWSKLADLGELPERLVNSLEFPWRFLSIATMLLTFVTCYGVSVMKEALSEQASRSFITVAMSVLIMSTGWYYYDFVFSAEPYRVYDTVGLNSMTLYSCDYLLEGTDLNAIRAGMVLADEEVSMEQYQKTGTTIRFSAQTGETGGSVDFPLNYYRDYRCQDTSTGEVMDVKPGYNNMVSVQLPAGYSGECLLEFKEPWYWRVGEAISFLTLFLLALCGGLCYSYNIRETKKQTQ